MGIQNHLTPVHQNLIQQVQYNCDISDANHAGNYTLCIYLLKMREYYRWMHQLNYADDFESEGMTQWLKEKEEIWEQVVNKPFKHLKLDIFQVDPFDSDTINDKINVKNLFYHAGIGQKGIQHFFIADLHNHHQLEETDVFITGKEYARDLTAPPAISTQTDIVIRQESLKRMCWERYQEWAWNKLDNPMGNALSFYPFKEDIAEALDLMVNVEVNTLIQHELGEMKITREFGHQWSPMLLKMLGSKAELLARGVRDHLADCLNTLPYLIQQNNQASLHFYFANLTYIRKDLFPTALQAYENWSKTNDLGELTSVVQKAADHWQKTIAAILSLNAINPQNPADEIANLIEQSHY